MVEPNVRGSGGRRRRGVARTGAIVPSTSTGGAPVGGNRAGGPVGRSPYGAAWRRVRAAVLMRDGFRCKWCGGPANTVDHVRALADGGATLDPSNLVAACTPCNSSRGREVARRRRAEQVRREGRPPSTSTRRGFVEYPGAIPDE